MRLLQADIIRKGLCLCLLMVATQLLAQSKDSVTTEDTDLVADTVIVSKDSLYAIKRHTLKTERETFATPDRQVLVAEQMLSADDSLRLAKSNDSIARRVKRDWSTWKPNAKRAMWLALVIPGAGQIYNRKYWKIPIVYGGFVGCIYAMRWNNQMYHDYSQAYLDIMDDDPTTESYNQFLHLGATINESNISRYQTLFKNRKDKYRRWRDLSFFCLVGVYALSVIDAYVDASLSEFDISKNLSMRVEPTIMTDKTSRSPLKSNSLGVSCSLNF